jgi:hypothetical protein
MWTLRAGAICSTHGVSSAKSCHDSLLVLSHVPGLGADLSDQFTLSGKLPGAPPVLVQFVRSYAREISSSGPKDLWITPPAYKKLDEVSPCDPVMAFKVRV